MSASRRSKTGADVAIGLALAAAVAALGYAWGMTQIPGFDAGPLVDMAWRMAHGLRPNVDFPSPFPPSFALPAKWAFLTLGAKWSSLAALGAVFGGAMAALVWWAWAPVAGRPIAFGLAALAAAQMPLIDGFWWYGSSAGVAAIAWAGLLAPREGPESRAGRAARLAAAALLLAFLIGAKPNEGWPAAFGGLLAVGLPTALGGQGQARLAAALGAAGAAMLAFACWAGGFPLLPYAQFVSHLGARVRQFPLMDPHRPLKDRIVAGVALALASAGFFPDFRRLERSEPSALARGGRGWLALGLFGSLAGAMALSADCALQAAPLLAAALALGAAPSSRARQAAVLACWALGVALALWLGQTRFRVEEAGVGQFWEPASTLSTVRGGFFDGVKAGPKFHLFLNETAGWLRATGAKRVFFGPRAEFGYAAFGLESPVGQPLWWDPKAAYRPDQFEASVARWKAQNYQLAILVNLDATYLPRAVMKDLSDGYRLMDPLDGANPPEASAMMEERFFDALTAPKKAPESQKATNP
jgi:hypothetical protein